jgi:hypothetical protein
MLATLLAWLVIVLGVCWLLLKFLHRAGGRERDTEEREAQNRFRK